VSARRGKGAAGGYTLVEVVSALGILAVGAAGVVAMQKAVLAANAHARNLAAASAVATTWAERVRVDALQWNDPGGVSDLGGTAWLDVTETQPGALVSPAETPGLGAPAADALGADLYGPDAQAAALCTHLRFTRKDPAWPDLIRVEIRVFWDRRGGAVDCAKDPAEVDGGQDRFGAVYLTTSVLRNSHQD
jgi:type IV pilus assembly protein PilV